MILAVYQSVLHNYAQKDGITNVEVVYLSCSTTRVCVARLHRMSHNQGTN